MNKLSTGKFIAQYIHQTLTVLKNPRQLIPTVVLGIVWLILALLGSFGINPLPVRVLSFLTFAQGGMFGGVFGAVGGILGKVVVASFLNVFIVPLFQKKAPFSGVKSGIKVFFSSLGIKSMNALSPLLGGIGFSLLIYAFMNNNQSLQNSMVGIIAFIMLLQNIGRKNGFVWGLVFSIAGSISKGKTPSYIGVSRYFSGMTLGFVLSVALSVLGQQWCVWLGGTMIILAFIFAIVSRNKRGMATVLCLMMILPHMAIAEETVEMPETMMIIQAPFAFEGEYGEITIKNETNGRFSFDIPSISWADGYGAKHTISGFHVEGTAYLSNGEDKIEYDYTDSYILVPKGNYFGYIDESQEEIIYTVVHDCDNYTKTEEKKFTIGRGHFFSTRNFDGELNPFELFMPYYGTTTSTSVFNTGEVEQYENEINSEEGFKIKLKPINFIDPFFAEDSSTTGGEESKISNNKKTNNTSGNSDYADPLTALIISVISILLSILFGSSGGFTPPVSMGAGTLSGGGTTTIDRGISRWIRFDDDGDLECIDPINGHKRTFVNNGDGTYTDPVTGVTYTPEELNEQMEHRAGNADTISQDEEQFKRNIDEDENRNRELSVEGKRLREDLQRERDLRAHREQVERVATNLGMSGASEEEVRKELDRRMERDDDFRQKMHDYADRLDIAVDTLEGTVQAADYAMAAGEALGGTPGKVVSATYKGIKNIGSTMAEKGASVGSFVEGAIKGGTEAASTVMDAGIGKAGVTIGGTVAGDIADAINDGEEIGNAIKEGLIKGAGNASIGAVGDAIGGAVEGEGMLNKAAEVAEKLGETAYGKEIVDPNIEKKFGK